MTLLFVHFVRRFLNLKTHLNGPEDEITSDDEIKNETNGAWNYRK